MVPAQPVHHLLCSYVHHLQQLMCTLLFFLLQLPSNTVVSVVNNNIYTVKVDVSLLKVYGSSSHCTTCVLFSTCFLMLPVSKYAGYLYWCCVLEEDSRGND